MGGRREAEPRREEEEEEGGEERTGEKEWKVGEGKKLGEVRMNVIVIISFREKIAEVE